MIKRWLLGMMVFALAIAMAIPVMAQDELTESDTIHEGAVSVSYPSGWQLEEAEGAAVLSSGTPVFDIFNAQLDEFPSDDMNLVLVPVDLFGFLAEIEDPTPANLAAGIGNSWLIFEDSVEEFDVNGAPAARIIDTAEDRQLDSYVVYIDFAAGGVAVFGQTALNALADYQPTVDAIVASIAPSEGGADGGEMDMMDAEPAEISLTTVDNVSAIVSERGADRDVYDGAFSPSGTTFALSSGSSLAVMDTVSGETLTEFEVNGDYVIYRNDEEVAVYDNSELVIYNAASGDVVETFSVAEAAAFLLNDEQALALVAVEAPDAPLGFDLQIQDLTTGEAVEIDSFAGFDGIEPFISFSDTRTALALGSALFMVNVDSITFGDPFVTVESELSFAAVSPDGNTVVVGDDTYQITAYDANSGEMLYQVDRSESSSNLSWATYSPDGSLVFVTQRETLIMIDAATGEVLRAIPTAVDGNFEILEISPDGLYMMGAAYDYLNVWMTTAE